MVSKSIAVLRCKPFWLYYQAVNDEPLPDDLLAEFGQVTEHSDRVLRFSLPCPLTYSIEIEVSPHVDTVSLGLRDSESQKISQMGWWDSANWHPHAIRWEELERIYRYWVSIRNELSFSPAAGLLLLARFIGNGVNETDDYPVRQSMVRATYRELDLFNDTEIDELVDCTFLAPAEDDYEWTRHPKLGWVFAGDYPCYSIRNAEHAGGSEAFFPFVEFAEMTNQLPPPDGLRLGGIKSRVVAQS